MTETLPKMTLVGLFENKRSETTKIQFKASQERLGFLNKHFITRSRKKWRFICFLLIYKQLKAKVSPFLPHFQLKQQNGRQEQILPITLHIPGWWTTPLAHLLWGASPPITSSHWGLKETVVKRERCFSGEDYWWVMIFCLCQTRGSEQGHFAFNSSQYKKRICTICPLMRFEFALCLRTIKAKSCRLSGRVRRSGSGGS